MPEIFSTPHTTESFTVLILSEEEKETVKRALWEMIDVFDDPGAARIYNSI